MFIREQKKKCMHCCKKNLFETFIFKCILWFREYSAHVVWAPIMVPFLFMELFRCGQYEPSLYGKDFLISTFAVFGTTLGSIIMTRCVKNKTQLYSLNCCFKTIKISKWVSYWFYFWHLISMLIRQSWSWLFQWFRDLWKKNQLPTFKTSSH